MAMTNSAESTFRSGFNCAQAVLTSFANSLDTDKETLFLVSNGFGGGMGKKQEVCGAISGGIMAIGLKFGRGEVDSMDKQETTYMKVRQLIDKFESEFGSVCCRDLLSGCNLLTDNGQKEFREKGLKERCCNYVRRVSEITEEITNC
jgi:C_GCAxxG_C_C family probable redox protein